jgi:ADP-ribose pyrophosphatase YjhB (NUDIX family)
MSTDSPAVQPIANLLVQNAGQILLVRYDAENPAWWLPGGDLLAYEHPEQAAARLLADLGLVAIAAPVLSHIESFRGRRGWHLVFHYVLATQDDPVTALPFLWCTPDAFPRTMHGAWERENALRALAR